MYLLIMTYFIHNLKYSTNISPKINKCPDYMASLAKLM